MQQTLTITNAVNLPLRAHAVRQGVPWPRGAVQPDALLSAVDDDVAPLPLAWRTLNCWPDGSVQWSVLDVVLDLEASGTRRVTIKADGQAAPMPEHPVVARETGAGIEVDNGLTRLTLLAEPGESLVTDWEAGDLDARLTAADGTVYSAAHCPSKRLQIEDANPLRAVLRVDGEHTAADGRTLLAYWLRFTLTANRRDVTVTYHYHNLEDNEPGISLQNMSLQLQTRLPADANRSIVQVNRGRHFRMEPVRLSGDVELCASNTMELDTYEQTHEGITGGGNGRVFIRDPEQLGDDPALKPWYMRDVMDFKFKSTDKPEAYTWSHIGLVSDSGSLVAAGRNMIGLHPKSLAARGSDMHYAIWPDWAGPMAITQGEGRTLDLHVAPLPPNAPDDQIMAQYLSWELGGLYAHWGARSPVQVSMDVEHVRSCEVFQVHRLPRYEPHERFAFERKVQAQWVPDEPAPANGHWHYGDVFYGWDVGGNNEEMAGHVWFQEYLRTGRPTCLDRGIAQAQHIADVDICAHSTDPFQHGGMCAHGPRHNHCAAYPSHMWFTELLFAYALTGDEEYRRAAVRVCDNLVHWVNDSVGFDLMCGDGRESGQPLINLAWAYQWIPEQRYLDAMWKIVRDSFMARVEQHGSLVYMKPREDLPLLRFESYGEWAAWEGLSCVWDLTGDEDLRTFILSQLDWRLTEARMATAGTFRQTDFNAAAYAYYLSGGDRAWLDRVARPFQAVFRAVEWPMGYIKSMYFLHLAFEHDVVRDEQVLLS